MKEQIAKKYKEGVREGKGVLAIIFTNIAMFIALNMIPSLREQLLLGQDINTILGQPWTLFTVFISHELFVHLILNMGILFFFGLELEKVTNSKTVIIVYVLAGLFGSITFPLTRMFIDRTGLIVGASAAVYGIVGAFGILRPDTVVLRAKGKMWVWALIFFSTLSVILDLQTLDSDVAHFAGLFLGVICGVWLKKVRQRCLRNQEAVT